MDKVIKIAKEYREVKKMVEGYSHEKIVQITTLEEQRIDMTESREGTYV